MHIDFLKMVCLGDSNKIKSIDAFQNGFEKMIADNPSNNYFYIAYSYFALNEINISFKDENNQNEKKSTEEIVTILKTVMNLFFIIDPIFKETYLNNLYHLNELFKDQSCKYFLIKIYNEIENLKSFFLNDQLERKKVLEFIEYSAGVKNHSSYIINEKNYFEKFEILYTFIDLLKIQNILILFLLDSEKQYPQILKNLFSIIIIKILSSIKSFPFNEEKISFGEFVCYEELYFDCIVSNKTKFEGPNNVPQTQIP